MTHQWLFVGVAACVLQAVAAENHRDLFPLRGEREKGTLSRSLDSPIDLMNVHSLYPSKQIPYHWFGDAVHVSGNMAIVGAPGSEDFSNYGTAYVYRKKGSDAWEELTTLEPSTKGVYDSFGASVSIYMGTAFVGAPKDDSGGTDSGAVYYFESTQPDGSGSTWTVKKIMKPDGLAMQDYFGCSISQYRKRHVIIGAYGDDTSSYVSRGSAFVYMYSDTGWQLEQMLAPGDSSSSYQWFGLSVGMAEDVAVVGAWGDNTAGNQAGAVFIYHHTDGGGWHFSQRVLGTKGSNFGFSVAIGSGTLVVGAPYSFRTSMGNSNNANAIRTGLVYVYRYLDYNHFEFDQYLECDTCSGEDRFGKSVAVSGGDKYGHRILVGQIQEIHLFEYDSSRSSGSKWFSVGFLETKYNSEQSYVYGSALSVSGKTMIVGVRDHTSAGSGRYAEAGTAILMDTDDGSDIDVKAIKSSFHVTLYICLYISIILGLAIILVVPLVMFAQYALQQPIADKSKLRERRPFLDMSGKSTI